MHSADRNQLKEHDVHNRKLSACRDPGETQLVTGMVLCKFWTGLLKRCSSVACMAFCH